VRAQEARGFAKRAAMLTVAGAGRTFVRAVAPARFDLSPLTDGAQDEEERQGHERYKEPRPHRRQAIARGARGI
jgi:hypothetical protein